MKNKQKVLHVLVCISILSSIFILPIKSAEAKSLLTNNELESTKLENQFLTKPFLRDGDLDPSFGDNGKVMQQIGCTGLTARDSDIGPFGKIVVVGDCTANYNNSFIARFNPDGSLDTSFGLYGYIIYSVTGATPYSSAQKVLVLKDNSILVAGTRNTYTAYVMKFNHSGSIDTSFANAGTFINPFSTRENVVDLNYDNNGRIILCGGYTSITFMRLLGNGQLDTSFGQGGLLAVVLEPGTAHSINDTVITSDNKIIATGYLGGVLGHFGALKITEQGTLDSSFGNGGKVIFNINGEGRGITEQNNGKIVIVGFSNPGKVCVRLNPDGSTDNSFGNNGFFVNTNNIIHSYQDVLAQSDGKIIIGGVAKMLVGSNYWKTFLTIKLNNDGTLDNSYGNSGYVSERISMPYAYADDIAVSTKLTSEGKIVQMGYSTGYPYNTIALMRLINTVEENTIDLASDENNYLVTGTWGSMIDVSLLVNNNGNTDSGSFDVVFYANRDGHLTVLREIGRVRVANVEPGSDYAIVETFDTTGFRSADFVWAAIDDGNEVVEIDEENNWIYTTVPRNDLRKY